MNFTEDLSLDRIRRELIRLEDSILFALIERAQFAVNPPVYSPGISNDSSFLNAMLRDIECVHGIFLNGPGKSTFAKTEYCSKIPEVHIP